MHSYIDSALSACSTSVIQHLLPVAMYIKVECAAVKTGNLPGGLSTRAMIRFSVIY